MKSHLLPIRMLRAEVELSSWGTCDTPEASQKASTTQTLGQETGQQTGRWRRQQKVTRDQNVALVKGPNRPSLRKQSPENNARERNRVRTLRQAFLSLQAALPSVPPDTKLSKLDVLVLATSYIAHLTQTLGRDGNLIDSAPIGRGAGYLHPMKKWPMRARLYAEAIESKPSAGQTPKKD